MLNPGTAFAVWESIPEGCDLETEDRHGVTKDKDKDCLQISDLVAEKAGYASMVEYQVSSKHLEKASSTFKVQLTGSWSESRKFEDDLYHLTAKDWDPEVFQILLDILHLRNRQVPSSVTLETLAKFAVLVDYYGCWEAVEVWTNIWIKDVEKKEPVPTVYSRELVLWMSIAWVFELYEIFNKTTLIALRQSQTPMIQDMGLPISAVVVGTL